MSGIIKRDSNEVTVMGGLNELNAVQSLRVDPATDRLLIEITNVTSTVPSSITSKIDENHIRVACGLNDTSQVKPFLIDNRNNLLWVDIA